MVQRLMLGTLLSTPNNVGSIPQHLIFHHFSPKLPFSPFSLFHQLCHYSQMDYVNLVVFAGGFLGGFVSGLAGFGTGLTALPIWLLSIPPIIAGPLVVICAIATHAQTLPFIWRSIQWRRLAPFLVSALFGIPLGTFLLQYFSVDIFRLAIGFLLIVYSSVMLIKRRTNRKRFNRL